MSLWLTNINIFRRILSNSFILITFYCENWCFSFDIFAHCIWMHPHLVECCIMKEKSQMRFFLTSVGGIWNWLCKNVRGKELALATILPYLSKLLQTLDVNLTPFLIWFANKIDSYKDVIFYLQFLLEFFCI